MALNPINAFEFLKLNANRQTPAHILVKVGKMPSLAEINGYSGNQSLNFGDKFTEPITFPAGINNPAVTFNIKTDKIKKIPDNTIIGNLSIQKTNHFIIGNNVSVKSLDFNFKNTSVAIGDNFTVYLQRVEFNGTINQKNILKLGQGATFHSDVHFLGVDFTELPKDLTVKGNVLHFYKCTFGGETYKSTAALKSALSKNGCKFKMLLFK